MVHFILTTEKTLVVGLARLFRDNIWKLHGLPESIISDREAQFAVGMIKKLNKRLGIRTEAINSLPSTDRQTDQANQPGA